MDLPHVQPREAGVTGVSLNRAASRISLVIFALAVVGLMAFGDSQASASHVSCGDTITADTTLDSDLVNCPNNGIVIGADDVTLHLNGHLIDGDGTESPACDPNTEFCDFGVVDDGHAGVIVRDGSLREFLVGVVIFGAQENRVVNISATRHDLFGVAVFESGRSVIRDSSSNRNIAPDGDGIGVFGSHRVRILDNSFRNNPGPGIHVEDSTNNLIRGNLFLRNSILIEADRNQVRRNRSVRDRQLGIFVSGNRNVIARNRVSRPVGGIGIAEGRGNLIARNVIVRARRDGIPLFSGDNNIIRRNRVSGSGDDGFWVNQQNDRILLRRNVAIGTGDDGFDVDSRSTKLTRNRAARNGDLGIHAVQGVIDGGRNRASGNGDPRQCVNVKCR